MGIDVQCGAHVTRGRWPGSPLNEMRCGRTVYFEDESRAPEFTLCWQHLQEIERQQRETARRESQCDCQLMRLGHEPDCRSQGPGNSPQ